MSLFNHQKKSMDPSVIVVGGLNIHKFATNDHWQFEMSQIIGCDNLKAFLMGFDDVLCVFF